ncbi:MAG TPA: SUF system Fe-S cluster assembly regulator [Burkholderiaceae bacterium]|nr:SUF system Fe-S cluster assembly regulator [Burkholderiaceae bacterium]
MLRISKIIDYGTLILTHMAGTPDRVISAAELASALGLGPATVSKVLKTLGQNGLVTSTRGSRGGYSLARPAEQINIAQIIDALDDQPFGLTECTATPGVCSVEADCNIRSNWERINAVVRRTLEGVTVADMVCPVVDEPITFHASRAKPTSAGSGAQERRLGMESN